MVYLRFCAVADEMNNKIYMIGGYHSHAYYKAYQYTISSNSWSPMWDSSLYRWARVTSSHNYLYDVQSTSLLRTALW